jgi:hypothetical protein
MLSLVSRRLARLAPLILTLPAVACGRTPRATVPASTAVTAVAPAPRSPLAELADSTFWRTLHAGAYDSIPRAMTLLKAAYLQNPFDARIASHIGFLHAWRVTERARLPQVPPTLTDDVVLARRYFDIALARGDEYDARVHGFAAVFRSAEGELHRDSALVEQGRREAHTAITRWPEFNWFTVGFPRSARPHESREFQEALEMQWRTLESCERRAVDRSNPGAGTVVAGPAGEPDPLKRRACWNTWIAPHNVEGFFLNMGDMLVKSGDWRAAQQVYALARRIPSFVQWPFRDTLETRVRDAEGNVAEFRKVNGRPMMLRSRFACVACHQAGAP